MKRQSPWPGKTSVPPAPMRPFEPEAFQPGQIYWANVPQPSNPNEKFKVRPVIIAGMPRPTDRLCNTLYIVPISSKTYDMPHDHFMRFNGEPRKIRVKNIRTIPKSLVRHYCGNIPVADWAIIKEKIASALCVDEIKPEGQYTLLGKCRIFEYSYAKDPYMVFDSKTKMVVIVGCNTSHRALRSHAMPVTSASAEGALRVQVNGAFHYVDTSQLQQISHESVGQPVALLNPQEIGSLNRTLASRLTMA